MWPRWAWLAGALVLTVSLRLWGIRWGLPDETHLFSYHPDEYHSLRGALSLSAGDPNPHFFNYGSLYLYLVALVCLWRTAVLGAPDLLAALLRGDAPHVAMAGWVLDARLVAVACGVATVAIVWALGRRLGPDTGAAVAALALAVQPLHALHSHYGTVDVALGMCVAGCLLATMAIQMGGGVRSYLAAGAAVGLAASVKYNGAAVVVAPLIAHFLACPRNGAPTAAGAARWLRLGALAAGAVGAFAATSPYVLLAWPEAWRDISFELAHMRAGESPVKEAYANGWLFHLHPSLLLSLAALALSAPRQRRLLVPLVAFGLIWFAMIGASGVRYARYELPLEPLTAVYFGVAVAAVGRLKPVLKGTALGLALVWGLALLLTTVQRDRVLAGPGTHDRALAGVLRQVPEGSTVGLLWPPWFSVPPIDYCNGGAALRAHPLFSRFQRPLRPLVTTGVSAEELLRVRPAYVMVSDLDLDSRFESVAPAYSALARVLRDGSSYREAGDWRAAFPPDHPLLGWSASDSRYPAPTIRLYARASGGPAPDGTRAQ